MSVDDEFMTCQVSGEVPGYNAAEVSVIANPTKALRVFAQDPQQAIFYEMSGVPCIIF